MEGKYTCSSMACLYLEGLIDHKENHNLYAETEVSRS